MFPRLDLSSGLLEKKAPLPAFKLLLGQTQREVIELNHHKRREHSGHSRLFRLFGPRIFEEVEQSLTFTEHYEPDPQQPNE